MRTRACLGAKLGTSSIDRLASTLLPVVRVAVIGRPVPHWINGTAADEFESGDHEERPRGGPMAESAFGPLAHSRMSPSAVNVCSKPHDLKPDRLSSPRRISLVLFRSETLSYYYIYVGEATATLATQAFLNPVHLGVGVKRLIVHTSFCGRFIDTAKLSMPLVDPVLSLAVENISKIDKVDCEKLSSLWTGSCKLDLEDRVN